MRSTMNFATPGADGQVRFVLDNAWSGTCQRAVETTVEDARPIAGSLSLEREGFVIDRVDCTLDDYSDPAQMAELWAPAVRDTVLRVTGGSFAALFAGPLLRYSEADPSAYSTPVSAPARAIHSDLSGDFNFGLLGRQPAVLVAQRHGQAVDLGLRREHQFRIGGK